MTTWVLRSAGVAEDDPEALVLRMTPGQWKTLGRSRSADFTLVTAMLSRVHCRFRATEDGLEVEDLDSTNGTWVNGERVTSAVLKEGDHVRAGDAEFVVSRGED